MKNELIDKILAYPSLTPLKAGNDGKSLLDFPSHKPTEVVKDEKSRLIENLPEIMEKLGWREGARMQRIWQKGGPHNRPQTKVIDCKSGEPKDEYPGVEIDWGWYKGFSQSKEALFLATQSIISELKNYQIQTPWKPPFVQKELESCYWNKFKKVLKEINEPILTFVDPPYWSSSIKSKIFAPLYLGSVSVEAKFPPDDLTAALNRHNLRFYLIGYAKPLSKELLQLNQREFVIEGILVRLYDRFDFNKHQYLGNWGDGGFETSISALNFAIEFVKDQTENLSKKLNGINSTQHNYSEERIKFGSGSLFNEDFEQYKKKFGKAQNFHIFTKLVKIEEIETPVFPKTVLINLI